MILIENKFCFIHIPKTSGSSFTQIICKKATTNKKTYNSGGGWQGTYHFNKGYCNGQHTIINDLKNDELKLIENIPIITIVRNPYSWLVSLYENFHGEKGKFYDYIIKLKNNKKFRLFNKLLQTEYIENNYNYEVEIYKFEENPHTKICNKYNIEHKDVHELNRNRVKKIKEYYNNELIEIVNDLFEKDFNYLNYNMVTNVNDMNI